MTIFKQRETGEEFDDGVPGDLGASAPRDIAYWHFNSANFDMVGPSPEPEDVASVADQADA